VSITITESLLNRLSERIQDDLLCLLDGSDVQSASLERLKTLSCQIVVDRVNETKATQSELNASDNQLLQRLSQVEAQVAKLKERPVADKKRSKKKRRERDAGGTPTAKSLGAYSAEEVREMLIRHFISLIDDLASQQNTRKALEDLIFRILCVFDGVVAAFPAFNIVPFPHPRDKAYLESCGEKWFNGDDVINDCELRILFLERLSARKPRET
jgi:hypothetical protein